MNKIAVFDLDGTLLDTLDDLTASVNFSLAGSGFPVKTREEVRKAVGHGIRNLIDRSVPEGTDPETAAKVFGDFKAHYSEHSADRTAAYPGVTSMLLKLRLSGVRIGVLSNKADGPVQTLMRTYFPGLIDLAAGEKPGVPKKPDPEGFRLLVNELAAAFFASGPDRPEPAPEVWYIGDSDVDVATARNAGANAIFADWGFRTRQDLVRAGAGEQEIVSSTEEMLTRLLKEE